MEAKSETIEYAGKVFNMLAKPKVDTEDSLVVGENTEYFLIKLTKRNRDKKVVGTGFLVFPKSLDLLVRDMGSKKAVLKVCFGAAKIATRATITEAGQKASESEELFD